MCWGGRCGVVSESVRVPVAGRRTRGGEGRRRRRRKTSVRRAGSGFFFSTSLFFLPFFFFFLPSLSFGAPSRPSRHGIQGITVVFRELPMPRAGWCLGFPGPGAGTALEGRGVRIPTRGRTPAQHCARGKPDAPPPGRRVPPLPGTSAPLAPAPWAPRPLLCTVRHTQGQKALASARVGGLHGLALPTLCHGCVCVH